MSLCLVLSLLVLCLSLVLSLIVSLIFFCLLGVSSKTVFVRAQSELWKSFLPEVEIYIYSNFYLRPRLLHLLQPDHEYICFINAEIQFVKLTDPTDHITIMSGYRNERWLLVERLDQEYRQGLADEMLLHFTRLFLDDVEAVMNKRESGWIFDNIRQINIVKIEREPIIAAYARTFNQCSYDLMEIPKKICRRITAFPERFLDPSLQALNICIPACIALKLEHIKHNNLDKISTKDMAEALHYLRYQEIVRPEHGISKSDISILEQLNLKFNKSLLFKYPFLTAFDGFSLCLFKMVKASKSYHLVNTYLSEHWKQNNFLQVHLLDISNIVTKNTSVDHVILILNFHAIVSRLRTTSKKSGKFRACHGCCKAFFQQTSLSKHISQCSGSGGSTGPRKLRNHIVHRPTVCNKHTGKTQKNVLKFKPRDYPKTFQTMLFACLDFEASNKEIDLGNIDHSVPNNSVFQQQPLGYSLAFVSPYDLTLPPSLAKTHIKFFNDEEATLDQFYIQLLKTLRQALFDVYNFIRDTLNHDSGPPDLADLCDADRLAFERSTNCSFCGIRYGVPFPSNKVSRRMSTFVRKRPIIAVKCRHHNHVIRLPNLAKKGYLGGEASNHDVITLCQFCNINCTSDGFIPRSELFVAVHNGKNYDFCYLHDMLARVGHTMFTQEDKNGLIVRMPIIKGEPRVLYKDKNTLLSLSVSFNCPSINTCPFHSCTETVGVMRNKATRSCPYLRRLTFVDSALHISASLDDMIQDVRNIHKGQDMKIVFGRSYELITKQLKYSDDVFEAVIAKKIPQVRF